MKIIYIHQYFRKPTESGGTRSYWIAKELIKKNHDVLVISTKNNMDSSKKHEIVDGIKVLYLNVPYSNNLSIFARIKSFLSFMFMSSYYLLKEKNVDAVFATSTPLTVGFPALIGKWFKGIPYTFEVRDLWPEVPIQMGALKNKLLIKLAVGFEKTIYKNASHIIALSPGMEKGVLKFITDRTKVSMIPNMSKIDEFFPRPVSDQQKTNLGLNPQKFNCIHFGAMGRANGLEHLFEAAKYAKDNNITTIDFVFLGEGVLFETFKKYVQDNALDNVKFLGTKALIEVSEIVNACDVSLVSFANIDILKTNSPNKLFDSLSAGKPIIVNSAGWTKTMVEDNNCGFYADITSPQQLVEKIQVLQKDIDLYNTFSINSRQLAETKYDKSILVPQVVNVIENTKK
ncbi:MAG: glycosyltransferase family 4 protein [Olleya sp.]